ncbi:sensor histidine kinase [Desulfatirhabdium butyrativorans]|uniref:sensor histidine kinase n=1 Tax=Desulfatirhabdium butyrativorans TaxID=340467 RepID=UPI000A01F163|nr:ATP-binding protein [Desulfatirhabdium butyrativorans]
MLQEQQSPDRLFLPQETRNSPVVRRLMLPAAETDRTQLAGRLKLLMFFRVVFTVLLLGSTIFVQHRSDLPKHASSLLILYGIVVSVFILSILYALVLPYIRRTEYFALFQLACDISLCSVLIYCTGSFSSAFSFLYLLVIVTAGVLLYQPGSLSMAILANLQYGFMLVLEWSRIIAPPGDAIYDLGPRDLHHVIYKIAILVAASVAVAYLSGFLAEQTKRSKETLQAMAEHIKRVEKLASLGEMAAGLAHEIKNPLASLVGAATMLKEGPENKAIQEKLMAIVTREANRLNKLLGDFLFFAKPPKVQQRQHLKLEVALNDILDLFEQDPAMNRKIQLTREIERDIELRIDPAHFHQVVWNLLLNAVEAVEDDGTITLVASKQKGGKAVLQISDSGTGIAKEDIARIFDPFYTTKSQGTGLGLSIVHRILEYYGGRIEVISKEGEGTTMKLIFPLT